MRRFAKFLAAGAGSLAFLQTSLVFATDKKTHETKSENRFDQDMSNLKLFSVTDQTELANEIAFYLNTKIGKLQVIKKDDKSQVNVFEDVSSKVIYLVCSFNPAHESVKDSIDHLVTAISTIKSKSPSKVNVILPFFGNGKNHSENHNDLPFTEEYLSELLENAGADKIFTINSHDGLTETPFHIPLVELDALRLCASYFKNQRLRDLVIVCPNEAVQEKANKIKTKLEEDGHKVEIGLIQETNNSSLKYIGNPLEGRDVLLVDNVVDSGKPLYDISNHLRNLGAHSIHMFAIHGLISNETLDFIEHSPIDELVITNTLQLDSDYMSPKINQISVAKMLADIIAQSTFQKNLQQLYQERTL